MPTPTNLYSDSTHARRRLAASAMPVRPLATEPIPADANPSSLFRGAHALFASLAFAITSVAAAAPSPAPVALADQLHARAMQSFQQGRFPEAYGRFVALADAGHGASARQALWMCEHGAAHFGREWDCAPHQVAQWAVAGGVAVPRLPHHEGAMPSVAAQGRRR